jgi:subtilisin family serine protease
MFTFRSTKALALVLGAALLAACSDESPESLLGPEGPRQAGPAPLYSASGPEQDGRFKDKYIVVFKEDTRDVPETAKRLVGEGRGELHFVYKSALKGFAATLAPQAVEALRHNPQVEYIEQDGPMYPHDPPQYGAPWGLDRVDQRDRPLNGTYNHFRSGAGVSIYIIDSGIRFSHAEFEGRATYGYTSISDGNGWADCHGHGTNVAGVAAGKTYGVAKKATLISVRIADCNWNSSKSGTIGGIDYVAQYHRKPAVANMSFGSSPPGWWERTFTRTVEDAIRGMVSKGVTAVVSAGNDGINACDYSPARLNEVITVGASDANDSRFIDPSWWTSNYGSCVDIFAPTNVPTAGVSYDTHVTTGSGTSNAAPAVAGAVALLLEGNSWMSPASVRSRLLGQATPNRLSNIGGGSPNLLLYTIDFSAYINGPYRVTEPGTYTWNASHDAGLDNVTYVWQYRDSPYSPWQVVGYGSSYSRDVAMWDAPFELHLTVTSREYTASSTAYVEIGPEPEQPPCDPRDYYCQPY